MNIFIFLTGLLCLTFVSIIGIFFPAKRNKSWKIILICAASIGIVFSIISFYKNDEKLKTLQPRNLSSIQKNQLIVRLSEKEDHTVVFMSRMGDGESFDYTEKLASIFKEAGWNVGRPNRGFLEDQPGFFAVCFGDDDMSIIATFVRQAFEEINIECNSCENVREGSYSEWLKSDTIYIFVGRKG